MRMGSKGVRVTNLKNSFTWYRSCCFAITYRVTVAEPEPEPEPEAGALPAALELGAGLSSSFFCSCVWGSDVPEDPLATAA
jgi:hypothetical protein